MTEEIVKRTHPTLRMRADEVAPSDIGSKSIDACIAHMKNVLDAEEDGAALAAPQVGVALRIFVIAERLFGDRPDSEYRSRDPHFVFINPVITKLSKKKVLMDEGCLSVREEYGKVPRSQRATVTAYDEHGTFFTRGASGLLAQVFQHEIDHLDGILFVDKATELWQSPVEKKKSVPAS